MRQWLIQAGCSAVFLADHPVDGIAPGELWRDALRSAARSATAAILLVSKNWLSSVECQREFDQAYAKRILILPVIIDPELENEIPEDLQRFQFVRIARPADADAGYAKLKRSLLKAGIVRDQRGLVSLALGFATMIGLGILFILSTLPDNPFASEGQFVCTDENFMRRVVKVSSVEKLACFGTYLCEPGNMVFRDQANLGFDSAVVLSGVDMELEGVSSVAREYPQLIVFLRSRLEQKRESKSSAPGPQDRAPLDTSALNEYCHLFQAS